MLELKSDSLRVRLSPLGARLVSVFFQDADMLAGGGTDEEFLAGDWTAGAVCGRVAGRITNAKFELDGVEYQLVPNMGEHQLHGGPSNFGNRSWYYHVSDSAVRFTLHSPDGDQGYPGMVEATATYRLAGNMLSLELEARASKPTVINLTNHAYWNLSGGVRDAFAHEMMINGSRFLPLNDSLLPTGEQRDVAGTRWDFRTRRAVGENYDNCWVTDGLRGDLKQALVLRDPVSGRRMEVWATEQGVQMYTAAHWNEGMPGRNGPLKQYAAIAIEPQNFPDAPNHAGFPSAVLRPGETYHHRIEWRFS
jgi:aldose 1-epimerase